ncbi:diacylglycerol kinase catalytic domain protein [Carnobacterium sp. AT7]|uniref:diacylglycerol/lipid kinase family protein n=1 Tax=Carnobacterium TaxID=2747 RepID=UPI00015F1A23|nr:MULTISPECIES: diacylglycerol kinase family protein [Carnobacterium]EDP68621.1 diacylglycerol kinase catalytic domain protein [Carnobacterium sp. AT7]
MTKAVLIVNPSSGGEKGKEYAALALDTIESMYDEVVIKETTKGGDAEVFAKAAAKESVEAVFVMGGDGTVNECICGLAEEAYRPKLGIIPLGTVNDVGRALGIPLNPEAAIRMLPEAVTKELDIGKVNESYFIDVIAIGKIPEAVKNVGVDQKTRLGSLAYFIEGAKAFNDSQSYSFKLTIDDEVIEQESSLVLIALTNSVGGFENMIPHAKTDDGYLHLIALKGKTLLDKVKLIPKVISGNAAGANETLYRKFKSGKIAITEENTQLISNIDGDEGFELPLTLQVLPRHITMFIPDKTTNNN